MALPLQEATPEGSKKEPEDRDLMAFDEATRYTLAAIASIWRESESKVPNKA